MEEGTWEDSTEDLRIPEDLKPGSAIYSLLGRGRRKLFENVPINNEPKRKIVDIFKYVAEE